MVIAKDVRCLGCTYNLRGLSEEGTCPECGRSIRDSLNTAGWLQVRPFLLLSLGLSYSLAFMYFAIVSKFDLSWMAYTFPGGAPFGIIWGTIAGVVAWPLMCLVLPRRGWLPYLLVMVLFMLVHGGILSVTLAGSKTWPRAGLLDECLFYSWPAALWTSIGICAALRKIVR